MKRLALFLVLIIVSAIFVLPCGYASAMEEEYLKITSDNTVVWDTKETTNPLFTLKAGCYVKWLATESDYYKIEYYGFTAYVAVSDITDTVKYSGLSQYYHDNITVHAVSKDYLQITPQYNVKAVSDVMNTDELTLIGTYKVGANVFLFVRYKDTDKYGAISKSDTDWNETANPIKAPVNTPAVNPPASGTVITPPTSTVRDPQNNLVRILLIIGICIPAVLIVYLIFKPVKPDTAERYATDNPRRKTNDFDDFD